MTGRNCIWLDLNFVTLYVLLAIMTLMAGYGCAVIWQNDCTCLTVSFDSVKSQSMKRWLALSRFWSEIDWQFSDPRIVTGWSSLKFTSWMRVETHQLNASWNSPVECELKLTSWNWTHLHVNFQLIHLLTLLKLNWNSTVECELKLTSRMRVETHQLKLNSFACEFFNWSTCLHSWSSTEIQQLNASWNSPVECELKLTSWMRVETHQLKLNSFACEFFNWSTCLHSWSSTEIHQLNASWNWPVECELKLTSWNWTHLHVNFSTVHSWNSTEFQLSLGWNSLVESPMFFFVWGAISA